MCPAGIGTSPQSLWCRGQVGRVVAGDGYYAPGARGVPAMGIRIVTLNIRHGGGKRIARLADWIASKSPNVVVLPEWRNDASGQRFREILTDSGLTTIAAVRGQSTRNSVLLAALDFTESWEVTPATSTAGDLILIEVAKRIRILGCYFPQRQAKAPFFQQCIEVASKNRHLPFVLIGDINTGSDLDIEGAGAPFIAPIFLRLSARLGSSICGVRAMATGKNGPGVLQRMGSASTMLSGMKRSYNVFRRSGVKLTIRHD
jgi:hypothetical protein